MKIMLIQGANMNLLGSRDRDLYGSLTKDELNKLILHHAAQRGVKVDIRYTNQEGECIDWIQEASREGWDGLIMNPGGFTRSSLVIGDALAATKVPYVEIHMKNLESHSGYSMLAEHALGVIMGFKAKGYLYSLDALCEWLKEVKSNE